MAFETEQIEVFSPEQKELFAKLMSYLGSNRMFPGGTYKFRSPRIINNAMSSFPEGNPWRGVSQTGNIPDMSRPEQPNRVELYRQAALQRAMGQSRLNRPRMRG